jgi:DNA-binding CsgD family transcriptional regulator
MVASATQRERTFGEVKRLCYAGLDATTLLREVTERLSRATPFDSFCAQTNDPLSGLLTGLISDGVISDTQHPIYLGEVYFEQDYDEQRRMVQNRMSVVRLSDATDGKLERALRYREITGPLGLGYELLSVYAVGREQWGGICLMREAGCADFDDREVTLMQQLAPHLAAGLKSGILQTRALTEETEDATPGVLVIDDRGRVVRHTASAERWLRDLDDLEPGWIEGRGLPAPVWTLVGALRRALLPAADGELHSVPRVRVQTRSGRWLTFHGARSESPDGEQNETIVMIAPSRPQELAWLRASAYGLSGREREVVNLVALGASTREMSQLLFITENTIQEHLSNAFDKVGVRGRRALIRKLFFDNLVPTLGGSTEDS